MYKKVLGILFLVVISVSGFSQQVAIKTNLLYGAYTLTPNLGLELALGNSSTLGFGGGYNPWNLEGSVENNKKLVH